MAQHAGYCVAVLVIPVVVDGGGDGGGGEGWGGDEGKGGKGTVKGEV